MSHSHNHQDQLGGREYKDGMAVGCSIDAGQEEDDVT